MHRDFELGGFFFAKGTRKELEHFLFFGPEKFEFAKDGSVDDEEKLVEREDGEDVDRHFDPHRSVCIKTEQGEDPLLGIDHSHSGEREDYADYDHAPGSDSPFFC